MPRDRAPDSTLALLREGYRFMSRRFERYGADAFQTRLLGRRTICLRGRDAARLFYDTDRIERNGAAPGRIRKTLTGVGGVQGLDGTEHRDRKRMFMSIMTPASIGELGDLFERRWRDRIPAWRRAGRVVLHHEVGWLLCRAVHDWAGVPLDDHDLPHRTGQLQAMIAGPGAIATGYLRGRLARVAAERTVADQVRRVRAGELTPPPGSALRIIAEHRDGEGRPLEPRIAAVEVLNILRPTVAIDRFVTFTAVALHAYPHQWAGLAGDERAEELFVQEVRRCYPFFPAVPGRVRTAFRWREFDFPRGRRVLLDLYGTNHDPRTWPEPDRFRPQRFRDWDGDPFSLIPQGGGEHHVGHRCAGEWLTIELMRRALRLLTGAMRYDVPAQDLTVPTSRIPALPSSGFVISDVRPAPEPGEIVAAGVRPARFTEGAW
ncbi:cytochrome P450 [Solwaraspora sp. WMMD1047]|uniref:cytochrome P450 n=1 Tax=Solwaraspora sp. WMMD1047 TaxID=3016102 RepID=UPI0024175A40|nr:cytochrome P450 [Solwaraspora sp. WMMD1047]MDG4827758.1 cytochrome P450 [Solwaraspora sp. WMMD1047]